jgi:diaminopimelate epimerase
MGNPHAVFYCPQLDQIDLQRLGPAIENHKMFPQRVNVHFVQVIAPEEVIMRTWERGSGITLACGTGAAAVCVAGVLASKTAHSILAHLPGGDLQLLWNQEDNHVYLVGPATEVFTGDWPEQ